MRRLPSSGRQLSLQWPWGCRPLASWSPSRQSHLTSLPWRWVRWEPLVCVPVRVLDWRQSVMEGPSSFQFPIVSSLAWWSQGTAWLAQCHVLRVSVLDSSLLLLPITPACQVNSSGPSATRMSRLFVIVLDATSSRFRSRGATSWVHAELLVCVPRVIVFVSFFLLRFFLWA
jgi:hypothetical protein